MLLYRCHSVLLLFSLLFGGYSIRYDMAPEKSEPFIDDFRNGNTCRFRSPLLLELSRCSELSSQVLLVSVVSGNTGSVNAVLLPERRFSSDPSLDTAPAHNILQADKMPNTSSDDY